MSRTLRVLLLPLLALALPLVPTGVGAQDAVPRCHGKRATIWQGNSANPEDNVGSPTDGVKWITGTDGDDVIVGSSDDNKIDGLGGRDRICGLGGEDVIWAGDGRDFCDGGSGVDRLYGCEKRIR